eukprot:749883-Hanusia_phi.AAC.1
MEGFDKTCGKQAKAHYHLDRLKVYRCKHASSRKEFETKYGQDILPPPHLAVSARPCVDWDLAAGPKLYHGDPLLYDFVSKIEPMKRALNDLKVWTLRLDQ